MSIRSFLLYFLSFFFVYAHAQDEAGLKRALDLGKKASKLAQEGSVQFVHAEILFEEALQLAPEDVSLNIGMGLCQLNGPQRHLALPYFQKAIAKEPETPHLAFLTAFSHQLNGEWEQAIMLYEAHKKQDPYLMDPDPLYNTVDRRIRECRNGIAAVAKPSNVEVLNMGPTINSQFADYGPLVSADGEQLIYTSRRPENERSKVNKATADYFEDIYSSKAESGSWKEAVRLPEPVNSAVNDASVGLFNDGRYMVIYRDQQGSGDLYESKRTGSTWSGPVPFNEHINSPGHESSAWYSYDKQWLYFVSDGHPDNVGGQDIYRSRWDPIMKDWGEPEDLGPTVNTTYDEDGVFVHPDGKTIYFSSMGHNSIGGYDIFRSTLENGQWTKPESLGWPINSPDDDLFFVLTADGSTGYFSSYRPGGMGEDDLYQVRFDVREDAGDQALLVSANGGAPMGAPMSSTVVLKGKVKAFNLLDGMEAEIQLMDLADASLVAQFGADPSTGEYLVAVPAGREYAMYVKADGFLTHSENISVPDGTDHLAMELNIEMAAVATGSQVTLKNLFFESGSAKLAQSSLAELNQLEALLGSNTALRLEIAGHTDNTGSADLNKGLSDERAQTVVQYLVKRGVDPGRLQSVGFGDTQPVAPNDSPANKALNRRTEIRVL